MERVVSTPAGPQTRGRVSTVPCRLSGSRLSNTRSFPKPAVQGKTSSTGLGTSVFGGSGGRSGRGRPGKRCPLCSGSAGRPRAPRKLKLCPGQGETRPQNADLPLGEVLPGWLGRWRAGDCPHCPMWPAAAAVGVHVGSRGQAGASGCLASVDRIAAGRGPGVQRKGTVPQPLEFESEQRELSAPKSWLKVGRL